jgi:hypothetical protein
VARSINIFDASAEGWRSGGSNAQGLSTAANLRVVDASIIFLEVQGNIETAVCAVAEEYAD